jgi:Restriction endonuclease
VNLDQALGQFDVADANLHRLAGVWGEMRGLIPDGMGSASPDARRYDDLRRAFADILTGLPPIDGWRIAVVPLTLDEILLGRFDAHEAGEVSALVWMDEETFGADGAIDEYRFRLRRARSKLIRPRAAELIGEIDRLIVGLNRRIPADVRPSDDPDWGDLRQAVAEIERLVGPAAQDIARWRDLARHLSFGERVDLSDITEHDWPAVRPQIEAALFTEHEPLPIEVADLGALVDARPEGRVSTALAWDRIDAAGFERLIYNLVRNADGYENALWPTRTNAPDRGRDLSVERVSSDALSGTIRRRVIIQCKHLQASSVTLPDASSTVAAMSLWEPPPVEVLVIATSGRFTTDAIDWIEKHNGRNQRPQIEMWPESHLESLLAQRPDLVAEFDLRAS